MKREVWLPTNHWKLVFVKPKKTYMTTTHESATKNSATPNLQNVSAAIARSSVGNR
jgi:hypothetical protein